MRKALLATFLGLVAICAGAQTEYVKPSIGTDNAGNCLPGPSRPFGLVKPGVNCGTDTGSGWRPMPQTVDGFGQVHMSGAGGGPKYGNVMVQPFAGPLDAVSHQFHRESEDSRLGYYTTTYEENGIRTEIACTESAVIYRFNYPEASAKALSLDAGFFLGRSNAIDAEEAQQLVGSEIEIVSDREIRGHTRVRGGWNKGAAYTVFFWLESDTPFAAAKTWKGDAISDASSQADTGEPTGALVSFAGGSDCVNVKVGISYLGSLKARENIRTQIPHWSLEQTVSECEKAWKPYLERIEIDPSTPDSLKTMFYTGLYHAMMHPTDKTGECPLWNDDTPYYDDYFALWDTFRTSFPLYNLVYPEFSTRMLQSMLTVFKRQRYVPDGRSGHWNGRTQGGSNANIIFADAFLKGVDGVDWELALASCLKDADVPPGNDEEAEGRGGLPYYNTIGYVPYGLDRSCSRTVDYSVCDAAIAVLARGLGKEDIAERFEQQSGRWKNLWRDVEDDGVRGFIMPRNADGSWVTTYGTDGEAYTPHTGIWEEMRYTSWWGTCFYEGTSWQYSLAVPHDIPGLIGLCGGPEAFEHRLDTFFGHDHFDVSNEPSFVIPCLYHWIGKPWKTSDCVRKEVVAKFNTTEKGIPGNDDTGAMSSWLDFHILGIYPIAGQDIYLLYSPLVASSTLHLPDGDLVIRAEKLSDRNRYIQSVTVNGKSYPYSAIRHADIAGGAEIIMKMGPKPSGWGRNMLP